MCIEVVALHERVGVSVALVTPLEDRQWHSLYWGIGIDKATVHLVQPTESIEIEACKEVMKLSSSLEAKLHQEFWQEMDSNTAAKAAEDIGYIPEKETPEEKKKKEAKMINPNDPLSRVPKKDLWWKLKQVLKQRDPLTSTNEDLTASAKFKRRVKNWKKR
eukprot:gnl/MRDRNA2_/MRDRNA2_57508_c0_seq1.p3 gnl/MRDRNA2_/MRDRNA2_57508_c0~~gnl/MRDRNA2_/MRDRNA2_57508_c0_seq1.p3  ORF type:complete len:161 (+),score=40.99 gnl/MRDRNA2_/MRDRNA2_57508_c0_seq1:669-1151(+)